MLLRERLGLDKTSVASLSVGSSSSSLTVATKPGRPHGQDFTKSEKEMCNMMAKASNDGIKSTPPTPPPHINRFKSILKPIDKSDKLLYKPYSIILFRFAIYFQYI